MVAAAVFVLDRVTKSIVAAQVPYGSEVSVIDHIVGITNVHNSGAAFGIAPAGAGLFLIASVAVAIGLAIYVFRTTGNELMYGVLGLIMGGTIGNGYERLVNGTVALLQHRGLFRTFYPGSSLREHLGLARPANQYATTGARHEP